MVLFRRTASVMIVGWVALAGTDGQAQCGAAGHLEVVQFDGDALTQVGFGGDPLCLQPPPQQPRVAEATCSENGVTAAIASSSIQNGPPIRIRGSARTFVAGSSSQHIALAQGRVQVRAVGGPVTATLTKHSKEVFDGVVRTQSSLTFTVTIKDGEQPSFDCGQVRAVTGEPLSTAAPVDSTAEEDVLIIDIESVQEPTTFTWSNPAGGSYADTSNWEPDCDFPQHTGQRSDTAVFAPVTDDAFNEVASYAVAAAGATAGRFLIDEATLNLNGTAQVFGASSTEPSLAIVRGGRLILDNAARLSGVHAGVGFNPSFPDALAGLEISGAGSDCTLSGRLIVGEFSGGELFLAGGATLSCAQAIIGDIAAGQASVNGAGSRWDADSLTLGAVSAAGTLEAHQAGRVEVVGEIVVSDLSTGTLRLIDGGKVVAGEVVIGKQTSGVGAIELNGDNGDAASSLEVNGPVRVGVAGDGTLDVREGSSVHANELHFAPSSAGGSIGQSHVIVAGTDIDGAVSDLTVFTASRLSHGQLEVLDGAGANFLDLTLGAGGITDVDVSGFAAVDPNRAATLTASRLTVGFDDFATLRVDVDGLVTCSELSVDSRDTGGTGRIIVHGGRVIVDGTMRVSGDFQAGDNVIIEDDGIIIANALRLGDQDAPDSAEIVVRNGTPGGGSSFLVFNGESNGECSIGKDGPGVLRLENRAAARITGSARVGNSPTAGEGLVEIGADCTFNVDGNLDIGGASPGTIRLLTASSSLNIGGSAAVNAGGRVEGIGTFDGPRFVNPSGFVSPGLSPGTLTIDGDYEQQAGGTLIIEVAGLEPGRFDVLHVTGRATLGGKLEVRFLDGFQPQGGDAMEFVQADAGITGSFAETSFVDPPPGFQAGVEVTPDGKLRLAVVGEPGPGADAPAAPENPVCGNGAACGAIGAISLCFTILGLGGMRLSFRRREQSDGSPGRNGVEGRSTVSPIQVRM